MINSLKIKNFKCIDDESFVFGNLNIITGVNSAGKSSVIQAILLYVAAANSGNVPLTYYSFDVIKNRYLNAKELFIDINDVVCKFSPKMFNFGNDLLTNIIKKGENLFYLNETRIGPEDSAKHTDLDDIGDRADFVLSYLYKHKSDEISPELVRSASKTLSQNVDYWLQYFFEKNVELKVEKSPDPKILGVSFNYDELEDVLPTQLGAGLSYAAEIIITCLRAKPGQIVIIENPEIHLHPAAQSKMGEFLSFVAAAGIQVIIETHCEHLINRIRYEVYLGNIESNDVKIFYKKDCRTPFEKMGIFKENGRFNKAGEECDFPAGFFDATLRQLMDMG